MKRNSFTSHISGMSVISSERTNESQSPPQSPGSSILFFGYGPIVNEIVRKRRGIRTTELQAAFLDGYRLSFEFGGVANVVRQRGFRVHGVLITLNSLRDFKKLQSHDIRRQVTQRLVFNYPKGGFHYDEDAVDEEEKEELSSSMAYIIEFPDDVQETLLSNNPVAESLPQESYLKLIADGMQQNRVMYNYIEDSILNIPYIPDRCVADYVKFPDAPKVARISFSTYQNLCESSEEIYFVLGDSVLWLARHDPNNPLAKWLEEHGHGKGCITFFVQIVLMNTNMPFCNRRSEVTPAHIAWAENQLSETIEQHGLQAMKIFEFVKDDESEDGPSKFFTLEDAKEDALSVDSQESAGSLNPPTTPTKNKRHFKEAMQEDLEAMQEELEAMQGKLEAMQEELNRSNEVRALTAPQVQEQSRWSQEDEDSTIQHGWLYLFKLDNAFAFQAMDWHIHALRSDWHLMKTWYKIAMNN